MFTMNNYFLIPDSEHAQAAMKHPLNVRHMVSTQMNQLQRKRTASGMITVDMEASHNEALVVWLMKPDLRRITPRRNFAISNTASEAKTDIYLPPSPECREDFRISVCYPRTRSTSTGLLLHIQAASPGLFVEVFDPRDKLELKYCAKRRLYTGEHCLRSPHALTIGPYKFRIGYSSASRALELDGHWNVVPQRAPVGKQDPLIDEANGTW